ncbi:uncharacterized mitochondrial protein AtMg00860-like [Actinidia eriantha]|uniref:uncharacterized mitochondrial protein AtMg00860-like n=1 Tax=Actinidia eriantha TaxID=165200 RepID=UPI002582E2A9|nr:uncharacterized mitochondrial protein AtMg00860-like [Actinidia eriantha]
MIEESPMLDHIEAEDTREEVNMITPLLEISFHAIARTEHPQTLRVVGKLKNNALTVLIDGGSTHNFIDQVAYLGHLISSAGVAVDPGKISSVLEWPTLTSAQGVRGFLGLARYYRKFIRGFGGIAALLTQLLSKDGFKWTSNAATAFS